MLAQRYRGFEVLPALDVLEGRAVRLREGRREDITIEGGDPVELATRWAAEGAARLHLVDLDGAFGGRPTEGLVERVAGAGLPVQVGGGYRTLAEIDGALAAGADRVIVGTGALEPEFVRDAARRFGDHLLVAIDVRDGRVAIAGWTKTADLAPAELAAQCAEAGVSRFLVTSTRRDGSLAGPDLALVESIVPVGVPVVAAGGVASVADVVALRDAGCEAAVAGSALLAGAFTIADARAALAA